jgi:transposase
VVRRHRRPSWKTTGRDLSSSCTTAKRIFDRLREEHGFGGGYTIVKDYARRATLRGPEMFVPLTHPVCEAQVDFGEVMVAGLERRAHYLVMDLPHLDDCFVVVFLAETTEAFPEGHVRAFACFGGVPTRILYDNSKIAVAKILGGRSGRERGPSPSCRATICSPTSSAVRGRATTGARRRV